MFEAAVERAFVATYIQGSGGPTVGDIAEPGMKLDEPEWMDDEDPRFLDGL